MFILTQNHYNLTDEQGSGYYIQRPDQGEGIRISGPDTKDYSVMCYVNNAVVLTGTEKECVEAMKRLALSLRAGQWYGTDWIDGPILVDVRAIIHGTESTRLETLDLLSEDLSDSKGAQKALHATARALALHKACAVDVQKFADEMMEKYKE